MSDTRAASPETVQLHIVQPYKIEVGRHRRVREYLDSGYRIRSLQRVTDREVLVTLTRAPYPA